MRSRKVGLLGESIQSNAGTPALSSDVAIQAAEVEKPTSEVHPPGASTSQVQQHFSSNGALEVMLRCLASRLPRASCYSSRWQLRSDQNDRFSLSSIVPRALHFPLQTIRRDMATSTTTSHSEPIEEETLPDYDAEHFYPIHIGDTLNARYSVLGKLGYGITSTVWLCRDLKYTIIASFPRRICVLT